MKNKIIAFFLGIFVVIAFLWIKRTIYLISNSDPDYNTVYSSKYNEMLFNEDLIGKSENELEDLLGKPFYKYKDSFINMLLYTTNKNTVILNKSFNQIQFKENRTGCHFRCFYFDSVGAVKKAKINGYNDKENDYLNFKKEDIIKKFGLPDDEIYKPANEVLTFSALTKGTQSGKKETINIRRIIINRNKVAVNIIKEVSDGTIVCKSCEQE